MEDFIHDEMRELSHVVLVITLAGFSIILVALNMSQGWEKWTIPVIIASVVASFVMHVSGSPGERERVYIFSVMVCLELFYYIVSIDIVYNCAPVAILFIILLSTTKERRIVWICVITSVTGLLFRAVNSTVPERIILYIIMVLISGYMTAVLLGESKRNEGEFIKYINLLKQQNKSADDFLANVSHEIRTPVNAVIGLTEIGLEREKNEEIVENLNMISAAGKRIAEQISDILDYSEIERGMLAVNMEDYRLSQVVNDLRRELRKRKNSDLEVIIDVDPAIPLVMRTDTAKLKRIIYQVVNNAFKYTDKGGVSVRYSCTKQDYGVNLCIEVEDTGLGMSPEEKERISERFYQSDSGRNRASSGLGLGMAIAKGFTDALEGFISVESKQGVGTKVRICIPQEVVNDNPCMVIENREEKVIGGFINVDKFEDPFVREAYNLLMKHLVRGLKMVMHRVDNIEHLKVLRENLRMTHLLVGEKEYLSDPEYMEELARETMVMVICSDSFTLPPDSSANVLRKPFLGFTALKMINSGRLRYREEERKMYCRGVKLLVVDDEYMNRMVSKNILMRYGIEVDTADSGKEAVEMCLNKDYDVIFMDYMMPQMDGIEAARQIRSNADKDKCPAIVAFTANAVSAAKEIFMKEGFSGFLSKPIEIHMLERVLKSVIPESRVSYVDRQELSLMEKPKEEPAGDDDKGTINVEKGMSYCLNDKEMYSSVLQEFIRDSEDKMKEMENYFSMEAWDEFRVRIHSVKSSSLMIGAEKLSKDAKLIEDAVKNNDIGFVKDKYPEFLPGYREVVRRAGVLSS